MSVQVEKIHLRDANNVWASLPEWIYNQKSGRNITLGDVLEGAIGGASYYGICSTAANEAAKTVTVTTKNGQELSATDLYQGLTIIVRFENTNTASNPTLNVGNIGAKPIYRYGNTQAGATIQTSWPANSVISLTYENSSNTNSNGCWILNDLNTDTNVTQTVTSSSGNYPIILKETTSATPVTAATIFSSKITADPSNGNIQAEKFNGYVLGEASEKTVDTEVTSEGKGLPTTTAVDEAIQAVFDEIPSAADTVSYVSTVSAVGSATAYARADHRHAITKDTVTSALGFTPTSTDDKVSQTRVTTNNNLPIILKTTAETAAVTTGTVFGTKITANPSTGNLNATSFNNITLSTAAGKSVDNTITPGLVSVNLPTTSAVVSYTNAIGRSYYGVSLAGATAAEMAVTCTGYSLINGSRITVRFSNARTTTATPSLNINDTGAKYIYENFHTQITTDLQWDADSTIDFVYYDNKYIVVSAPLYSEEVREFVDPFEIIQQPVNTTYATLGDTVTLTCQTNYDDATYLWQRATPTPIVSANTITGVTGGTTNTLTVNTTTANAASTYRCKITSPKGTTLTSNAVSLSKA